MVLENKLGLTNEAQLAISEERICKIKTIELYQSGLLDSFKIGTYESLAAIHKYLFGDLYYFAGKIRDVNLSKDQFVFAPARFLTTTLETISTMPQSFIDQIIDKYIEMNIAHPFREGNGRSIRIWLDLMCIDECAQVIDWSKINKEDYLKAIGRSPANDLMLNLLLKSALTTDIRDNELILKSIDASFCYEGFNRFKSIDLL